MRKLLLAAAAAAVLAAATGRAADVHGVPVYPGASVDTDSTAFLRDQMKLDAKAFKTPDDVAKVAAFYKTVRGLKIVSEPDEQGAMYRKGDVDVTLQRPYMDMKTGQMVQATLVSIVKQKR
jgi:hypothetical protein